MSEKSHDATQSQIMTRQTRTQHKRMTQGSAQCNRFQIAHPPKETVQGSGSRDDCVAALCYFREPPVVSEGSNVFNWHRPCSAAISVPDSRKHWGTVSRFEKPLLSLE